MPRSQWSPLPVSTPTFARARLVASRGGHPQGPGGLTDATRHPQRSSSTGASSGHAGERELQLKDRVRGRRPVPGFVNLQVKRLPGVEAPISVNALAGDALLETGVAAYLRTFITSEEDDLIARFGAVPARAEDHGVSRRTWTFSPSARVIRISTTVATSWHPSSRCPGADRACSSTAVRTLLGQHANSCRRAWTAALAPVTHVFNTMRPFSLHQ